MPFYWLVMLITGIALNLLSEHSDRAETVALQGDTSAIAHNLLIYRQALAIYAQAHSETEGAVEDFALKLPGWFEHLPGVEGYVSGGASYTFYAQPPAGLATRLAELTTNSTAVGLNVQGRLVSPSAGETIIVLPPALPMGAAVLYR